jgi:hypothetical protein
LTPLRNRLFQSHPDTSSPTVLCTERLASAEGGTSED